VCITTVVHVEQRFHNLPLHSPPALTQDHCGKQTNGVHAAEIQNLIKPGTSEAWKEQGFTSKAAGAVRCLWTEPWWTREWWTKKRIIVGVTVASLIFVLFLFLSGSGNRSRVVDSTFPAALHPLPTPKFLPILKSSS
jgi:hypothetical protein